MDITYYALKQMKVNGELRQPGDLIPEAQDWAALTGYIADARIAPVLVATLPKAHRDLLAEWEEETYGVKASTDDADSGQDGGNQGDNTPAKPTTKEKAA